MGGVARVGIDLATGLAICRGNDGKAGGAEVDGGEVEAPYGVGMRAFGGVEGECAGEAILWGQGASAGGVSGALRVSWGEVGSEIVGGKKGFGPTSGLKGD